MGRKSLISILIIVSMCNVLAQNIKNFPSEFKNKVFCGEAKLNGTNGYSKSVSFLTVPFKLTISDEIIEFSVEFEGSWQVCQTFDKISAQFTKSGTDVMYDSFDFSVGVNNESIESQNRKPIMTLKSLSVKVVNPNFVMTPTLMRAGLSAPSKNWISCNIEYGRMSGGHKPLYVESVCGEYITEKAKLLVEKQEKERQEKIAKELKLQQERLAKERQIEIKIVSSKLDSLLKVKDFLSAAELYIFNNGPLDLSRYRASLIEGLTTFYSGDTVLLDKDITNFVIRENLNFMKSLSLGKHVFYFRTDGKQFPIGQLILESKQIPLKYLGTKDLEVGNNYLGGIVIERNSVNAIVSTKKPIGMNEYSEAITECSNYKLGNMQCRLPSRNELETIFRLKNELESFKDAYYWAISGAYSSKTLPLSKSRWDDKFGDEHVMRAEIIKHYSSTFGGPLHNPFFAVSTIPINHLEIPQNSKIELSVDMKKDVVIQTKYSSSSKKPILMFGEDQFCYKAKGNSNYVNFNYNESLKKNTVIIERTVETTKTVNGIIVFSETMTVETEVEINRKCTTH